MATHYTYDPKTQQWVPTTSNDPSNNGGSSGGSNNSGGTSGSGSQPNPQAQATKE